MLVLRSKNGDKVCVVKPRKWDGTTESLGYPDWDVLEDRRGPVPEDSTWVDGKGWIKNKQDTVNQLEKKLNNMTRMEFFDYIMKQVRK